MTHLPWSRSHLSPFCERRDTGHPQGWPSSGPWPLWPVPTGPLPLAPAWRPWGPHAHGSISGPGKVGMTVAARRFSQGRMWRTSNFLKQTKGPPVPLIPAQALLKPCLYTSYPCHPPLASTPSGQPAGDLTWEFLFTLQVETISMPHGCFPVFPIWLLLEGIAAASAKPPTHTRGPRAWEGRPPRRHISWGHL